MSCSAVCCESSLEHWVLVWTTQYKDINYEKIQRRATKMMKGLESKIKEKGLTSLGLFSSEQREAEKRTQWLLAVPHRKGW